MPSIGNVFDKSPIGSHHFVPDSPKLNSLNGCWENVGGILIVSAWEVIHGPNKMMIN